MHEIVINIMENVEDKIKNAIKLINKQQSFVTHYYHFIYFLINYLTPYFHFFIYHKIFEINDIIVKYNEDYHRLKLNSTKLFVLDNGINFLNFLIPYENVINFNFIDDRLILEVFAKIENDGIKKIKINLSNTRLYLSFKYINAKQAQKCFYEMKSNMYYHIKYHKYNLKTIEYF